MSPQEYKDLVKILYLYVECVITATELYQLLKGVFVDEKLLAVLVDIAAGREAARRKNILFRPLVESDVKQLKRYSHSYTDCPNLVIKYSYFSSNRSEWVKSNINSTTISIPQGSEHYTFVNMRKNIYEEALFKCEDEKYDFDLALQIYRQALNYLERLKQPTPDIQKYVPRLIRLKVLQSMYKLHLDALDQLIAGLQTASTCHKVADILILRVNQKMQEMSEARVMQANKLWIESDRKNYRRSLDHRSFYFKKQEKKLNLASRYVQEAIETANWKPGPGTLKVLNTFEGITMGYKCSYEQVPRKMEIEEEDQISYQEKPIYKLFFNNNIVLNDTLSIFYFYLQNFHQSSSEKEKVKKTIKTVLGALFSNTNCQQLEFDEFKYNELLLECKAKYIERFLADYEDLNENQNENIPNAESQLVSRSIIYELADQLIVTSHENQDQSIFKEPQLESQKPIYSTLKSRRIAFISTGQRISTALSDFSLLCMNESQWATKFLFNLKETEGVTTLLKGQILLQDRYETFKQFLIVLIKQKIDQQKYEDNLRALFGNKSFILGTIDKILALTVKSAQQLSNDNQYLKIFNLTVNSQTYKMQHNHKRNKEEINIVNICSIINDAIRKHNQPIPDKNIYRFYFEPTTTELFISFLELPIQAWNLDTLGSVSHYFQDYVKSNSNKHCQLLFMKRNYQTNRTLNLFNKDETLVRVYINNKIEYKSLSNSKQLINNFSNNEDYLISQAKLEFLESSINEITNVPQLI